MSFPAHDSALTALGPVGFLVGALLLLPDASPGPRATDRADLAERRQASG
ncbi:MAG: hypothetical protein ACJ76L_02540 [Conexibacter sp.]